MTALLAQARGDESAYDDYTLGKWAGIAQGSGVRQLAATRPEWVEPAS